MPTLWFMWSTLVARRMLKVRALYLFLARHVAYWRNNREGDSRVRSIARYCVVEIGDCAMGAREPDGEMVFSSGRFDSTSFNMICRGSIKRRHQATSMYTLHFTSPRLLTTYRGKPSRNTASPIFRLRKYLTNSGSLSRPPESERASRKLVKWDGGAGCECICGWKIPHSLCLEQDWPPRCG